MSSPPPCIVPESWIGCGLRAVDVERLQSDGDLILLDADAVLTQSMVEGMPDGTRFHDLMIANIERACRGREDCVVRAYGEMVDVLWKRGLTAAATRLEFLWNQLAQTHRFSLLCGYSMGNFYKDAAQEDICRHHTHVLRDSVESQYKLEAVVNQALRSSAVDREKPARNREWSRAEAAQ